MTASGKYEQLQLDELQALRAALNAEEEPQRASELDAAIARKQSEIADGQVTKSASGFAEPVQSESEHTEATHTETFSEAESEHIQQTVEAGPESRLASLGERFAAAVIDIVINILISIPLIFVLGLDAIQTPTFAIIAFGLVYSLVTYVIVHGYFLFNFGQTVGKRFLNIRIENLNGQQSAIGNIVLLRYLPILVLVNIPFIGGIIGLVDICFIFRKDRRCVHDFIASTRVCRVPESITA